MSNSNNKTMKLSKIKKSNPQDVAKELNSKIQSESEEATFLFTGHGNRQNSSNKVMKSLTINKEANKQLLLLGIESEGLSQSANTENAITFFYKITRYIDILSLLNILSSKKHTKEVNEIIRKFAEDLMELADQE